MNEKGFSLIELLVALTIFAIGLLAVASMQGVALGSNQVANRLSVATAIAQEVSEDVLSWSEEDARINATATNVTYDLDRTSAATTRSVPGAGIFTARYSTTVNTPTAGVTQITVSVRRLVGTVEQPYPNVTITCYKRVS